MGAVKVGPAAQRMHREFRRAGKGVDVDQPAPRGLEATFECAARLGRAHRNISIGLELDGEITVVTCAWIAARKAQLVVDPLAAARLRAAPPVGTHFTWRVDP